jgi:alanine-synthesizing transaminase
MTFFRVHEQLEYCETMKFAQRTNWDLRPNELAEALAKHRAAGKPLIDLTVSNPTECGFAYETEKILDALRNAAAMRYEPDPRGMRLAREAVAGYYADRGDSVSPEDMLLTTSTSEAYSWIFRLLCDAGDEVLIPSPGYPLFDFLADIHDVKLVRYPLFYDHGWHYDLHALEQAITPRTRAVIVVHPNNPTGNYWKAEERARLNEICLKRGLAIVADEVFLDYALDGQRRASFAGNGAAEGSSRGGLSGGAGCEAVGGANPTCSAEASDAPDMVRRGPLTFTLSGISKICGLPQMKLAWMVVSGAEEEKAGALERLEVISDTYLSLNAPMQLALPTLLETRQGFQRQVIERVRANVAEIDRQLADGNCSPEEEDCSARLRRSAAWTRLELEGGWCAVLRAEAVAKEAAGLAQTLLDEGVCVYAGGFYGLRPSDVVLTVLGPIRRLGTALEMLQGL